MATFVRSHAATLFGLASLLLWAIWGVAGVDYDAGGAATALFVAVYLLCLPFGPAAALAGALLGDTAAAALLWIPLGLAPYVAVDWIRRRRARSTRPAI